MSCDPEKRFGVLGFAKFLFGHTSCKKKQEVRPLKNFSYAQNVRQHANSQIITTNGKKNMKTIKHFIIAILICGSAISQAQTVFTDETLPDTLVVLSSKDDMTDKISYFPSSKIVCANEDKSKGFSLSAFIESNLTIKDLKVKMVNIGSCVEKNEMIILFDDDTKLTLTSWNDFNCKGDAWFTISKKDVEQLSSKKIKKVRLTNGRSYESYTGELKSEDQDYFIKLFGMLNAKQTFGYKGK